MTAARPLLCHDLQYVELLLVVQHVVARDRQAVSAFLSRAVEPQHRGKKKNIFFLKG